MRETIPTRGAFRVIVSYLAGGRPNEQSSNHDTLGDAYTYAITQLSKGNVTRARVYSCLAELER